MRAACLCSFVPRCEEFSEQKLLVNQVCDAVRKPRFGVADEH